MGLLSSSKKNAVTNNSTVNDNRVSVGEGASVIDLGGGTYDQSVTDNSSVFNDYSVNDSSTSEFTDNSVTTATDNRDYSTLNDFSLVDNSDRSFADNSVTTATDSRDYSVNDNSSTLNDFSLVDNSDRSFVDNSVTTATDSRDYSVNDSSDRSYTDNSVTTATDSRAWDYSVSDSSTDNRDFSVNDYSDRSFTQNYNITALDGGAIAGIEGVANAAIGGSARQLSAALDFGKGALDAANETTRTTAGLLTNVLGSQQEFARGFVADFYKSQQTEQERGFDRIASMGTVVVLVIGAALVLRR